LSDRAAKDIVVLEQQASYTEGNLLKSTVEEIRQRFDAEVDRFSNLETGQSATVDAPLAMTLVAQAAAAATPQARQVVDVGCGAGNYTLKLLQFLPNLDVTLIDLSRNMLNRALERISEKTSGQVTAIQSDIRQFDLPDNSCDLILASAVLHHLRTDAEWESVFTTFHQAMRPGGSIWIFDLIESSIPAIQAVMWTRYGEYLSNFKGDVYRDQVFAYVEKEDTPRSLVYQLDLLRRVGFAQVDVLHKNSCFAAFGAVR
jgi:tRNA (cmo5U34)-methyltransferase